MSRRLTRLWPNALSLLLLAGALLMMTGASGAALPERSTLAATPYGRALTSSIPRSPRLHPALYRTLAESALTAGSDEAFHPIIIEWRSQSSDRLAADGTDQKTTDRLAKRRQTIAALQADAERSAGPVRAALAAAAEQGLAVTSAPSGSAP